MKNLETNWLGGVTAESYVAGCVQFTWEDSEGKPKVQKVYYQAGEKQEGEHELINNVQVFGIKNPSAPMSEQETFVPAKKLSEQVVSLVEVKEHVAKA